MEVGDQAGKPLAFGEVCGTPVFGLPGNPVSSWMTFALVAKPWLIKRQAAWFSRRRDLPCGQVLLWPDLAHGKSLFG